jgi:hypothetical protein
MFIIVAKTTAGLVYVYGAYGDPDEALERYNEYSGDDEMWIIDLTEKETDPYKMKRLTR